MNQEEESKVKGKGILELEYVARVVRCLFLVAVGFDWILQKIPVYLNRGKSDVWWFFGAGMVWLVGLVFIEWRDWVRVWGGWRSTEQKVERVGQRHRMDWWQLAGTEWGMFSVIAALNVYTSWFPWIRVEGGAWVKFGACLVTLMIGSAGLAACVTIGKMIRNRQEVG